MDLFNTTSVVNLLPYDGTADYYGKVFTLKEAQQYLERLLNSE